MLLTWKWDPLSGLAKLDESTSRKVETLSLAAAAAAVEVYVVG